MCPKRWWFADIEGLRSPTKTYHRFGRAWHECLEEIHRWWMKHDLPYPGNGVDCVWCSGFQVAGTREACTTCEGSGRGPVMRYKYALRTARNGEYPVFEDDEVESEATRLQAAFDGWLRVYGRDPSARLKVVAVEVAAARVIRGPTGRPYCPETLLIREQDGDLRIAGTGEATGQQVGDNSPVTHTGEVISVRWPYYQISRFDCVYQHRTTGVLLLGEWKSSASPRTLVDGLNVDPQTDGYVWVLEAVRGHGFIPDGKIGGYLYDVTSSHAQHGPKVLKPQKVKVLGDDGEPEMNGSRYVYEMNDDGTLDEDGESNNDATFKMVSALSTAKSASVPSWLFQKAIVDNGLEPADYADHVTHLRQTVDPKIYIREYGTAGPQARKRYGEEIYATAVQFANSRRAAARATSTSDLNIAFPRVPVCRLPGGTCAFRGPCMQDGDDARASFERGTKQTWTNNQPPSAGT